MKDKSDWETRLGYGQLVATLYDMFGLEIIGEEESVEEKKTE